MILHFDILSFSKLIWLRIGHLLYPVPFPPLASAPAPLWAALVNCLDHLVFKNECHACPTLYPSQSKDHSVIFDWYFVGLLQISSHTKLSVTSWLFLECVVRITLGNIKF